MDYNEYIKSHTLRCEARYRGGAIEIDCTDLSLYRRRRNTAYNTILKRDTIAAIQSDNQKAS